MNDISGTDLKTILHSKRANLYDLALCRALVDGGRVDYVTERGKQSLYWNTPIANTTTLLLGTCTSVRLQTGRAFCILPGLGDDKLAIRVGGTASRELFEHYKAEATGSASRQTLMDERRQPRKSSER